MDEIAPHVHNYSWCSFTQFSLKVGRRRLQKKFTIIIRIIIAAKRGLPSVDTFLRSYYLLLLLLVQLQSAEPSKVNETIVIKTNLSKGAKMGQSNEKLVENVSSSLVKLVGNFACNTSSSTPSKKAKDKG